MLSASYNDHLFVEKNGKALDAKLLNDTFRDI
jgi:hypothetical protein